MIDPYLSFLNVRAWPSGLRIIFVFMIALGGCISPIHRQPKEIPQVSGPPPIVVESSSPRFQPQDCWFQAPEAVKVTCGYVTVPEDHAQPMIGKNIIRLAVAIFHSLSTLPAPAPVVYQVGGPGGHMLVAVGGPFLYEKVIASYVKTRDLILFDPRGTGYSQPALECKPGEEPGNCLRRLFSEGHNLYLYNSSSMVADLQDIRQAIGYDQWNLVGESYGTHVSQMVLHEQPDGLRSVILDAVLPIILPDLPDGKSEFGLSLGRLFERCWSDPTCKTAYPDLANRLDLAVHRLNDNPVAIEFDIDGKTQSFMLTGDRLMDHVMTALYEAEMIPYLPYAISAAADGSNYEFWGFTAKWSINIDKILSSGAHWAILCGDGRIHNCDNWPVAIDRKPVTSPIPTLILSGEFDPVTPPEYGHAVAMGLRNSFEVVFPGFGHWVNGTGNPCQSSVIQSFLENPSRQPDAGCIKELTAVDFFLPHEIPPWQ